MKRNNTPNQPDRHGPAEPAGFRPSRLIASALAITVALSACGSTRSVEAFCETMISEQERIVSELEDAQDLANQQDDELIGALIGIGSSFEAIGELRSYTRKLADTAPPEIQTDAEEVADSMDRQFESMKEAASNPLGAIASSLVEGFASAGSMDRVDNFARTNCGRGI